MRITNIRTRSAFADLIDAIDLKSLSGQDLEVLRGFERGFNQREDLITETSDGFPLAQMWTEFQRIVTLWNRQRNPLIQMLTYQVTQPVEGVRYPVETDFQEASEFGVPTGQRLGPSFKMGYDFKWWDLATRFTWQFLIDADSNQLRALTNQALEADNRLMFTRVLRAIFNSTTRVATIEDEAVNVYPFYNGDSMVPPKWKNTVHTSGHTHYLESGATTVDPGDVQDMINHLAHHGYTMVEGYTLVLLVNSQEGALIRDFVKGTSSAKYTFIPSANVGGGILMPSNGGIVGAPTLTQVPGLTSIGTYGPVTVIEEDYVPAGYMVMLASGGPENINNPVGIRQHETVRGLRLVKGMDSDYPLINSYYVHGMGTGVRHRGAGVVMEIGNGGTYTVPSAYA